VILLLHNRGSVVGFRFRRSLKVLPGVRLNFSRSGASVSLGPRGLRHTIGPKGSRTTIGIPGTGLSWTEYSSRNKRQTDWIPVPPSELNSRPIPSTAPVGTVGSNLTPIESAPVERIGALSTSEFAPILNSATQRLGFAPWVTAACAVYFFLALNSGIQAWSGVAGFYALVFVPFTIALDRYRRSIHIKYVLEGTAKTVAEALAETFEQLKGCGALWQIDAQGGTSDWKRHAGATTLSNRKRIHPKFDRPAGIRGEVTFPALGLGKETLFFLPDTVLVAKRNVIVALPYQQLLVSARSVRFIEEETVPSDTTCVGQTWRFVNKNGDPDRRFNFNRQLPICLYGEIDLKSNSGLNYKIEYSNASAGDRFLKAINILHRPESLIRSKPITVFKKAKLWPSVLFLGCFLLALIVPVVAVFNFEMPTKIQMLNLTNSENSATNDQSVVPSKRSDATPRTRRRRPSSMPLVITPDLNGAR